MTSFRFLHIEIQTNPLENERTVYYICGYSTGQKYVIKNGVVQNFYEFPLYQESPPKVHDNLYFSSMGVESDIRKLMKPYLLLPAKTKINEKASMIIHGRGQRGLDDYLYWSGNVENAPVGISHIMKSFDQNVNIFTPTNHILFVQGISPNKTSSNIKRIKTSEFSQAGWNVIYDAIVANPYRLFIIDHDNPPIPLINYFRPIIQYENELDFESRFDIRLLPYYTSAHDETPTSQGVQP
jgi:hypothetical protein